MYPFIGEILKDKDTGLMDFQLWLLDITKTSPERRWATVKVAYTLMLSAFPASIDSPAYRDKIHARLATDSSSRDSEETLALLDVLRLISIIREASLPVELPEDLLSYSQEYDEERYIGFVIFLVMTFLYSLEEICSQGTITTSDLWASLIRTDY